MNVFQLLSKSAASGHGRELSPLQVREIVVTLQAMQHEIGSQSMRADGVTRIAAVCLNQLGGTLDIVPDMYAESEEYSVVVQWLEGEDEEGDVIRATLTKDTAGEVPVSEVQDDDGAADGSDSDVVQLHPDETGGRDVHRTPDVDGEDI